MPTAGGVDSLSIFKVLIAGLVVLHAFALIPRSADPDSFLRMISYCGDLLLPWAVLKAELFIRARFSDAGSRLAWLDNVRGGLFVAALIIGLALVAAEWVPVLEPFAHWVETRYIGQFPLGS